MAMPPPDARAPGEGAAPSIQTASILARTAHGAGWIVGWRMATRLLGLASTLALVRLLLPADFGLVALATSFAQAVDGLTALSVEEAVVRDAAFDRALTDTGFTLNAIRAALTGAAIAAVALPTAAFFAEPRLAAVLWALALAAAVDGFENIGVVQFRRDLAFEREFLYLIVPRIAGIAAAVTTAAVLHSYWALVAGIMTTRLLRVAFGYRMHPYRPRFTLAAWRRLAGYSAWSWALGIAVLLRDRSDSLLIGRLMGPAPVGLYTVGAEIAALPTTELAEPLARAAFAGFALARREGEESGGTFLRLMASLAVLTLPAGVGISLIAAPLVALAFGHEWSGAVPVVRIMAFAGILSVFGTIAAILLAAHAQLAVMVRFVLAGLVLRVVLLAVLIPPLGLTGAAAAAALAIAAEQAATVGLACRRFGVGVAALAGALWRCLLATAAMAAALLATGLGQDGTGGAAALATTLAGTAAVGAGVYAASLAVAWLAAGRPEGGEADLAKLVLRIARRRR